MAWAGGLGAPGGAAGGAAGAAAAAGAARREQRPAVRLAGCGCRLWLRSRCRGGAGVADDAELGTHLDGLVLADGDLQQGAGDGRRDLGVDLVGGHLDQRFVQGDLVADGLEPAGDGAFGDRLAHLRQGDRVPDAADRRCPPVGFSAGASASVEGASAGAASAAGAASGSGRFRGALRVGREFTAAPGHGTAACGGSAGAVPDDREIRTDGGGLVLADQDLLDHPAVGRRDLGVDLVRRDLEQRLVDLDRLAFALEPTGDGALGDALAEGRHLDGVGHALLSYL